MPRVQLTLAHADGRGFVRAFGETGLVVVLTGYLLMEFDRWDGVRLAPSAREVFTGLGLAATGVAGAAAALAMIGTTYRRLAAPLALYCLVLGPVGIVEAPGPAMSITRFAVEGGFLLLLSGMLWQHLQIRWMTLIAGVVVAVGVADAVEDGVPADLAPGRLVMVAGWWVIALALVWLGARQRRPATWRIGIGLSLVSMAHLEDFTSPVRISSPNLEFGALRLVGLIVVLLVLTDAALSRRRATREAASKSAEREHEIRNALSGLSGVGHLLGSIAVTMSSQERIVLGTAMQAELERMRSLLGDGAAVAAADTRLDPLLTRLVALRCAGGERITTDVPADLRVAMPAHALSQVLTNLLANCARHAAGSPVRIVARSDGDLVTITVADKGPGLPSDHGDHGDHGDTTAGAGIGLAVCERLLASHGGTVRLGSPGVGCTAEVRLPAAPSAVRLAEPA